MQLNGIRIHFLFFLFFKSQKNGFSKWCTYSSIGSCTSNSVAAFWIISSRPQFLMPFFVQFWLLLRAIKNQRKMFSSSNPVKPMIRCSFSPALSLSLRSSFYFCLFLLFFFWQRIDTLDDTRVRTRDGQSAKQTQSNSNNFEWMEIFSYFNSIRFICSHINSFSAALHSWNGICTLECSR